MLSVIPTPIGNKEDITLRALRMLKDLDIIFAEDVQTAKKLLKMYDIDYSSKKFYIFNSFLTDRQFGLYIQLLRDYHVGLVSEAGTPGLSDPAKELIKHCWLENILFEVLPGANALIPLVVASNWDTTRFGFWGFLPKKKGKQTAMKAIINSDYPIYVYESVHRIEKTLREIQALGFQGMVMVGRELTKLHEQYVSDSVDGILSMIASSKIPMKGEFVLGFWSKPSASQSVENDE